jgi:hypothetical protein
MTADNRRTATHLSRLGVNPAVVARLGAYAEQDGQTLRELVRYILSDYAPATDGPEPDGYRMGDGGTILPTSR